ncbi:MAG: carboxymuconolactone decarboxylase family protein [Pseudomonadales bacterium]|nr:carboxymuconolactone decarboxylase family protein [Pseudomonadales bacterium]
MSEEYREAGIEKYKEVYCNDLPDPPAPGVDKFYDYMLDTLFGRLWADSTLSIRERRLLLLGAIAAQGEEMTFTIQARSALKRGELSEEQLTEAVIFLTQYVGYPKGSKMKLALGNLLDQMKE